MKSPSPDGPGSLLARDVMSRELVTVELDLPLRGLSLIFHENRISGAPVVDGEGRLVGVVSQSDIIRYEARDLQRNPEQSHDYFRSLDPEDFELIQDSFITEGLDDARVIDIFTPGSITSSPESPLDELAALMVKQHIHRVIIVENGAPVGVVSSMDILATLIPAALR